MMSYLPEIQSWFIKVRIFFGDILIIGFISDEYISWASKLFYFS